METQIGMTLSRQDCHDEMSNPGTTATEDQTSCQSGCCLALSAPALLDAGTLRSMVPREPAEYALTDQLVTTYLKSDIRPPIS